MANKHMRSRWLKRLERRHYENFLEKPTKALLVMWALLVAGMLAYCAWNQWFRPF